MSTRELHIFRAALTAHLDWFAERGKSARFWWRDDDAIEPSPALDRLLSIANTYKVEVGLAVIPEPATEALADRLREEPYAKVLLHGWRHKNHQRKDLGEKAAEFGSRRNPAEAIDELRRGKARLEALFGEAFIPAFVPPWNRLSPEIARGAQAIGLKGISSFTWFHAPDPHRLQTHIDMIKWKKGRRFIGWPAAAMRFDLQMTRRRNAPSEPIGILSHHLAMEDDSFRFLEETFAIAAAHPGAQWPPIRDLFAV
ncbi:polysaccharide deacetylase family protein [Breoghania sp. L-A4]|uniref:polysaccharide deacetylase family protein n=1 Tax=Breoghania sp. L-A4 TaxID=2304600 RepID=UPI000E35A2BF|nr:polysaccharide deacetylase family protein [Breoghania sp. L-A4]AXS40007.1 glycosyl transferase family 28 [Breoghania sp. L-A4]